MESVASVTLSVWNVITSTVSKLWASRLPPPLTMEETVQRLEVVQTNVSRREEELRKKIEEHHTRAREYAQMSGRKREAVVQIRLKMLYETQLVNTHRTQTAIASHLLAIEQAVLNRQVLSALHDGSRALGHNNDTEDSVENLLDDLQDQHASTASILEIIQERPPDAAMLDEDDIEREFRALSSGGIGREETATAPRSVSPLVLPHVPNTPLPTILLDTIPEARENY